MNDGLAVAVIIMKKLSPDVKINVFSQLGQTKNITPKEYGFNMSLWSSKMEPTCADIERKVPGVYHEDTYLMDYFENSLQVPCKTLKREVLSMKNRWLLGNPDGWSKDKNAAAILKHYTNMDIDCTWTKKFVKTN